ncbi:MAG: valine--tRNA ligase, partial [Arenicellales bacterium WSBS_2016_MAG_OTU3]
PQLIEQAIYKRWEESGCFAPSGASAADRKNAYCIVIPPPNVTGSLHMGHAFQDTIMDTLIRYHRMSGKNTLWQAGSDHAGIATQMVVERQLAAAGKSRQDLGRDKFIERVWEWKAESGGTITKQLRRMGTSLDWSRERFTMDDDLSAAVIDVFVKLYDEGLIYRGKRLVNWDPVLHTAVSDLEVLSNEENGHLWHFKYPIKGTDEHLIVATTRPETMLGDTAVAVHPEDQRYKHLVGKSVLLPLVNRQIPIIADDYVDPEFGSGCVKITPAHDFNDYEMGLRHALEVINILTPNAAIDLPGTAYDALDRYDARKRIVADLEKLGLLHKIENHKLMVPRGDRSDSVIEPYLTDQWFVKTGPLAAPSIKAVQDGRIKFVPDNWKNTYFEWMNNIQDWCISRQIWWGHRIPAWYDNDGNFYVARNEQDALMQAKAKHGKTVVLKQDEDVLDTWFSSALWPFSTLGWPEQTNELKTFYPTSVLVTGFDIIFFWVARMIMFGLKFTGQVPFHEVYVHGLVRDGEGQKMSKSKGNVLDPLDLIDGIELEALVKKRSSGMMQPQLAQKIENTTRKHFPSGIPAYGTDAVRFTFASMATQGRDIRFDLGRVEGYRNFCNKLWNAARFVMLNVAGKDCAQAHENFALGAAEKWIISKLQQTEADTATAVADYRFDLMSQSLYRFIWGEYCSWYVEFAKATLNDDALADSRKIGTRRTLVRVLETSMRLLHPVMPFITEEIWQNIHQLAGKSGDTIMTQPYPTAEVEKIDNSANSEIDWVKSVITAVRSIRGEMNIEPNKRLQVLLQDANHKDKAYIESNTATIKTLAKLQQLDLIENETEPPESATALVGGMKILIPFGSFIDKQAEEARLEKEIGKNQQELAKATSKLSNANFVDKAPATVVQAQKQRQSDLSRTLEELHRRLQQIKS